MTSPESMWRVSHTSIPSACPAEIEENWRLMTLSKISNCLHIKSNLKQFASENQNVVVKNVIQ